MPTLKVDEIEHLSHIYCVVICGPQLGSQLDTSAHFIDLTQPSL